MEEHAAIHVLRQEVESDIIPMSRHNLMVGNLLVSEVFRKRKGEIPSLENSHLTLEVFILASVVILISISDTDSGRIDDGETVVQHASLSESQS
jgi:hypothetical protein